MTTQQIIADSDDDIRLDRWFKRHHPGLPHAMLEKQLRKGLVRVDGRKVKSSDRIRAGQTIVYPEVTIVRQPKKRRELTSDEVSEIRKWVLYKDASIIVINKPFGLPVQGGSKISKSVDDLLDGLAEGGERPKLVHRLDRDTSGCLVLARSAKVAAQLAKAFAGKGIEKIYWALVSGVPLPPQGMIDFKLLKSIQGEASFERVAVDEEEGKYAKTEYRVLDMLARKFALVELKPLTGRTHQLRVHMAAIGCPIVGDHKYGGSTSDAKSIGVENILHLHARKIAVPGAGGKIIEIAAPLPPHMKKSFVALGIDIPKK
jgi:23S rRNA pseudouridine955/2504/2580 synthase